MILKRFRKFNLYVKLIKYRFIIKIIEFLKDIINNHNISINSNEIKII